MKQKARSFLLFASFSEFRRRSFENWTQRFESKGQLFQLFSQSSRFRTPCFELWTTQLLLLCWRIESKGSYQSFPQEWL